MSDSNRVMIIPCSGIGKAYGSVGREAMYAVLEDLRPNATETVCLSLLTLGDEDAQAQVREHSTITIDGCPKACAKVNVEAAGGTPAAIYRVFDVYRAHKGSEGALGQRAGRKRSRDGANPGGRDRREGG